MLEYKVICVKIDLLNSNKNKYKNEMARSSLKDITCESLLTQLPKDCVYDLVKKAKNRVIIIDIITESPHNNTRFVIPFSELSKDDFELLDDIQNFPNTLNKYYDLFFYFAGVNIGDFLFSSQSDPLKVENLMYRIINSNTFKKDRGKWKKYATHSIKIQKPTT
jgi:hypothetical protein